MANLNVSDLRIIVPAKDFALSKELYAALGCNVRAITEPCQIPSPR